MHSKKYSRSGVFAWSPKGIDTKGLIVADFAQHYDPTSTDTQSRVEFVPLENIYKDGQVVPSISVPCQYRFNELVWSPLKSDAHPAGIVCGGTDDGSVVFFDAEKLIIGRSLSVLASRKDHHGHVMSVDCSVDGRWCMSGGGGGQLLLWDLTNLASPFSPGTPNSQDQVKMVRWNRVVEQIVASISSHRCSIYDMRRPGAPIIEFGEVGGGCDWSSLCWSPIDASTLILASQSDAAPLLQKWDIRMPTAPIMDYSTQRKGITAINWHESDPRLLLAASTGGRILIMNPDSGETIGQVGCEQGDWIRSVSWNSVKPDLLAVQYFQHPLQISSVEGFGGATESSLPVELNIVPAWVSAAPVGASFALGGRMATHYKQWDEAAQQWRYCVDIKQAPIDGALYTSATNMLNACEGRDLGNYCEDKAFSNTDIHVQTAWTFLNARSRNKGAGELIRILGFGDEGVSDHAQVSDTTTTTTSKLSTSSYEVSRLTQNSAMSPHHNGRTSVSSESFRGLEVFDRIPSLDFESLQSDGSSFELLEYVITGKEEDAVHMLLNKKDYTSAFMLALGRDDLQLTILQHYVENNRNNSASLVAAVATDSLNYIIDSFPVDQWQRVMALAIAKLRGEHLDSALKRIAEKCMKDGAPLTAIIPSIVSNDLDALLRANQSLPLDERMAQALVLRELSTSQSVSASNSPEMEQILVDYCEKLIAGGAADLAWRMLRNHEFKNKELSAMRFALYNTYGSQDKNLSKRVTSPYASQTNQYSAAMNPTKAPVNLYGQSAAPSSYGQSQGGYSNGGPPIGGGGYSAPQTGMAPPPMAQPQNLPGSYSYPSAAPATGYQQMPAMPSAMAPVRPIGPPPINGMSYQGGPPQPAQNTFAPPAPQAYMPGYGQPSQSGQFGYIAPGPPQPIRPQPTYPPTQMQPLRAPSVASSAGSQWAPSAPSPVPVHSVTQYQRPCTPGWNDPPPLTGRKSEAKIHAPVLEVQWKPLEQTQTALPHGLPGGGPPAMASVPPSVVDHHHGMQAHSPAPISIESLLPDDQLLIRELMSLCHAVKAVNLSTMFVRKADEASHKIDSELMPRLAAKRLSDSTRQLLHQTVEQMKRGDYAGALSTCGQMVRTGGDFVEISSFLPAHKALISAAQNSFQPQQHQYRR